MAYEEVAIFAAVAAIMPIVMVLGGMILGKRMNPNAVKNAPYESAEASEGRQNWSMHEYLHYLPLFISFEVIVAIMLAWAISAKSFTGTMPAVMIMAGIALLFMIFSAVVAKGKGEYNE